jgi:AraC-like DNA-binding protein
MQGLFSTSEVEQKNRFAYWRDLVCDVFVRLDCRSPRPRKFNATMRYDELGWMRVVAAESDAIEAIRSKGQISKGQEDDLLVSLQVRGRTVLIQDDRHALLEPGEFALYDSERPYQLRMSDDTELVCLQFPRRELISRLGSAPAFVARTIDGQKGIGNLFVQLARALPRRVREIDASYAHAVADHVVDLLSLSLSSGLGTSRALASAKAVALARLKCALRAHICDPDLKPAGAAALAGMSIRHANRLLAFEGTSLERYILLERLSRCQIALREPRLDHRTISDIAYSFGFNDCSHFSRSFRRHYGVSPKEFRAMRRAGVEDPR